MKKIFSIFLMMMFLLNFAACGEKSNKSEKSNTVSSTEKEINRESVQGLELFFDVEKYTEEKGDKVVGDDNSYQIQTKYTLNTKKQLSFSKEITIDSTEIVLGSTTLKTLKDNGWSFSSESDDVVNANISVSAYVSTPNNRVAITYGNGTQSAMSRYDCSVDSVSVNEYLDFDFVGLTKSSTHSDFVRKLGEPTDIFVHDYFSSKDEYIRSFVHIYYTYEDFNADFAFDFDGTKSKLTSGIIGIN